MTKPNFEFLHGRTTKKNDRTSQVMGRRYRYEYSDDSPHTGGF